MDSIANGKKIVFMILAVFLFLWVVVVLLENYINMSHPF